MTTDVRDGVALEWDVFLKDEERYAAYRGDVDHIDGWRKANWPQIVRELRVDFNVAIQDGIEPHWMSPGNAILWRTPVMVKGKVRQGSERGQRHNSEGFEEEPQAWRTTAPLPIGNANQLYRYLVNKGFRLRPPSEGVDPQFSELIAVEPAGPQEAQVPEKEFICLAHNFSIASWRGYLHHCDSKREIPDMSQMPEEEAIGVGDYQYYCAVHNFGTNFNKAAKHHTQWYHRTRATAMTHATVDQMKVKKGS